MLKKIAIISCALICIFCITACRTPKPTIAANDEPLTLQKEQVWQLTTMRGKPIKASITISFNTEASTLNGKATCNTYSANCRLNYSSSSPQGCLYNIAVANLSSGPTLCPEADMNVETRYLSLLAKADALLLTPYNLTLLQNDKEILHFELR